MKNKQKNLGTSSLRFLLIVNPWGYGQEWLPEEPSVVAPYTEKNGKQVTYVTLMATVLLVWVASGVILETLEKKEGLKMNFYLKLAFQSKCPNLVQTEKSGRVTFVQEFLQVRWIVH